MNSMKNVFLGAIVCILFSATHSLAVELNTPSGSVRGVQQDGVRVFRGIPYARPPVRFAPPEDIRPWTETRNCENFGPAAPQDLSGVSTMPVSNTPTSEEDCLTLNIWTPVEPAEEKMPVYVWIHGGAFAIGSGAEPHYDGTAFAKQGIVTVSINYRLGALGFLASQETLNTYGTTGNWGLLDQIKALEWVRDNIAAFGGDPERVTIGGQSAGSYSASALLLSPLAKGLFRNAIMESGSVLGVSGNNQYAKGNLERSIEVGRQLMFSFGAEDDEAGLAKLRTADADVFAGLSAMNPDLTQSPAYFMTPVFDGHVLPKHPVAALKNGEINPVNLLWGFTSDEGLPFVPATADGIVYKKLAAKIYGHDNGRKIMERFPVSPDASAYKRTREILAHGAFTTVMKPFADALHAKGTSVYGYYFDYVPEEVAAEDKGASHGDEIEFAFRTLPVDADAAEWKLSDEIHARWVNFIKSDNPNNGGAPSGLEWGKYSPDDFGVMIFREEPSFEPHPVRDDVLVMENIMFDPETTCFDNMLE